MTQIEVRTETETETVTIPPVAHTLVAAQPAPEEFVRQSPSAPGGRPTTAVEVVKEDISLPTSEVVAEEVEEVVDEGFEDSRGDRTVTVVRRPRQTRRPTRWFGGRW